MTISYPIGRAVQGVILSRTDSMMRVAIKDGDDAEIFTCVDGTWISEDCEPVTIRSDWSMPALKAPVTSEDDCLCSKELAARLLHALFGGEPESADEDDGIGYKQSRYNPVVMRVV